MCPNSINNNIYIYFFCVLNSGQKFGPDGNVFSEDATHLDPMSSEHWISKTDETNKTAQETNIQLKKFKDLSLVMATISLSSILHQFWFSSNMMAINIYQMTFNYWITG